MTGVTIYSHIYNVSETSSEFSESLPNDLSTIYDDSTVFQIFTTHRILEY